MKPNRAPGLHQRAGERTAIIRSAAAVRLAQAMLLVSGLCAGDPALAALGARFTAPGSTQARAATSRQAHAMPGYAVHETLLPSGTTVREYVGPDQRVFAVTWQGPRLPDLRDLLGDYFVRFDAAAAQAHAAHRPVALHQDDLVARSGGHMRAFHGSACVPGLMPAGMSVGDID
jgi:hypothetical protein